MNLLRTELIVGQHLSRITLLLWVLIEVSLRISEDRMIHVHTLFIEECDLDLLASLEVSSIDLAQLHEVRFVSEESRRHKELLVLDVPLSLARGEEAPA